MKDWEPLIAFVLADDFTNVDDAAMNFWTEIHYGGIERRDFGHTIFDPELKSLTHLPLGVLGEKRCLLPESLVPETPEALTTLCRRMIIIPEDTNDAQGLIEKIVAGWPGKLNDPKLKQHVDRMLKVRDEQPAIYRNLVTGHHGAVASLFVDAVAGKEVMVDGKVVGPKALKEIQAALIVQALLWSSHDVQMMIARNGCVDDLFEGLVEANRDPVPVNVAKLAKSWRVALDKLIVEYDRRQAPAAHASASGKRVPITGRDPSKGSVVLRKIRYDVEKASRDPQKLARFEAGLQTTMARVKERLHESKQVEAELSSHFGPHKAKTFHTLWFSGLSDVAASAVSIIRYLQAQVLLPSLIATALQCGNADEAIAGFAQARSVIDTREFMKGRTTRALGLVDAYRTVVLRDDNHRTKAEAGEIVHSGTTGALPLARAKAFLEHCAELQTLAGAANSLAPLDTLAQLDICPEVRFGKGAVVDKLDDKLVSNE